MLENSVLFDDLVLLGKSRVLCVGDVMLDRFVYGGIERISPEAPIPVLLVEREKHMLGGAGNVVANIAALGATAVLLAVVGKDAAGADVAKQLGELGVEAQLETSDDRFTTVKSRFVSAGQQMLRVDREKTAAIPGEVEAKLIARAEKIIPTVGAVILSDYKKGLLTDTLVAAVIEIATRHGKPVVVDPKGTDFSRYKGASVITPNRKELETATAMKAGSDEEVRAAAMKIILGCSIPAVLATRSKDGMSLVIGSDDPLHIPANMREVFDVSGAGDTVIATFASALAAGVPMRNAALLANIAAGIVVAKPGTATARPEEIETAISGGYAMEKQAYTRKTKFTTRAGAAEQAERWRMRGFKVGFTNGCFDLLHPGHVATLRQAKAACDYLVVAINSDASVQRLKGPTRPVQNEQSRAALLSALEMVDMVIVFDEDTPIEAMKAIKPDVLVKGGQYKLEEVVGYDLIQGWGGKVVRAEMEEGFSTTNTIAKMAG
ncbi:MAG TPA: D-glycero-beta-D-manno-heptose-7-phosphate kinase [Patescibacteria group bacterium]|nr:D-glycero-beta-D-manno-heptose-7-phosphate kinase [Patescibacteria group bacterium]